MPRGRRRSPKAPGGLTTLRRQAHAMMKRLERTGHRHLAAIERDIARLYRQREGILEALSAAMGGRLARPRGASSPSVHAGGGAHA